MRVCVYLPLILTQALPQCLAKHDCNCTELMCDTKKNSAYSTIERKVPQLIPVLDSQPAGDVSHKPGWYAATTFRQACSYPCNP